MKIRKNYNEKITTNLVDYNHLYLCFYVPYMIFLGGLLSFIAGYNLTMVILKKF